VQTNLAVPTSDVSTEPATCIRVFTVSMGNMTQCSATPANAPAIMYLQPATSPSVRRRGDGAGSRLRLRSVGVLPKGQAALFPTLDLVVVRHAETLKAAAPQHRGSVHPASTSSCLLTLYCSRIPSNRHTPPRTTWPPITNTLPQQSACRSACRAVGSGAQRQ
jgi:hypothetical protein